MAMCNDCKIDHPLAEGKPTECIRALREEIDFLLSDKDELERRIVALEARLAPQPAPVKVATEKDLAKAPPSEAIAAQQG